MSVYEEVFVRLGFIDGLLTVKLSGWVDGSRLCREAKILSVDGLAFGDRDV